MSEIAAEQILMPTLERRKLEARRRSLIVTAKESLSPRMLRVTFGGEDLSDFDSPSPDDHVKVFFPSPDGETHGRDYTPRRFSREERTLTLEFALHRGGVASNWAQNAKIGDTLQIGGPRGTTIISTTGAWWLLIGDETAIPSIGRRLSAMAPGTIVSTLIAVTNAAENIPFESPASVTSDWVYRPEEAAADPLPFLQALHVKTLPSGPGFIWIAAEGEVTRAIRDHFIETAGHPAEWIKASSYWSKAHD